MQLLPAPTLRPYIKHYLFIESQGVQETMLRIFADGNTGVVFSIGTSLYSSERVPLPDVFIYGQLNDYKTVLCNGPVILLIIVFRPFGVNALFGIPGADLRNAFVSFDTVFGTKAAQLLEQIAETSIFGKLAAHLDCFFTDHIPGANRHSCAMVSAATDWMLQRRGQFTAKELADFTGYSQRSTERAFNEAVGLSPKKLGGIIKLHNFLGVAAKDSRLTAAGYEAGYYDQAHLIREFKKLTGITPSAYYNNSCRLAVNMISFLGENVQLQQERV